MNEDIFKAILNAYPYEIVYCDLTHTVRWMNKAALLRYEGRVKVGNSLFNCHNEQSRVKIEAFLKRAETEDGEFFEALSSKRPEREFFVPVKDKSNKLIGYFERHEIYWDDEHATENVYRYWDKLR